MPDQACDALTYLTDKYIGSKFAKASEFAYYLQPNTKFRLEAEAKPMKIFGQNYLVFADFNLESCGEKIEIPTQYKGLCEALMLHFYKDNIIPSIDSVILKEIKKEKDTRLAKFIAKYCS